MTAAKRENLMSAVDRIRREQRRRGSKEEEEEHGRGAREDEEQFGIHNEREATSILEVALLSMRNAPMRKLQ